MTGVLGCIAYPNAASNYCEDGVANVVRRAFRHGIWAIYPHNHIPTLHQPAPEPYLKAS